MGSEKERKGRCEEGMLVAGDREHMKGQCVKAVNPVFSHRPQ